MKLIKLFLAALLSVSSLAFAEGGGTPNTPQTQKQEKEKSGLKKNHEKKMEARSNKKGEKEITIDVRVKEKEGNSRQANSKMKQAHQSQISRRYASAVVQNDGSPPARQPASESTGGTP